jgi:sugar phosphate isomerase/epimerase
MRLSTDTGAASDAHLTYCTNIHAGETWAEVFRNLKTYVLEVRRRVAPGLPFGVGLRLSAAAASALAEPQELERFKDFLRHHDLYVFTINGFPFGAFHGTRVKELVYRPDWLEDERVAYSDLLARLLAELLPRSEPGLIGSISTVPGCFEERGKLVTDGDTLARRIASHALTLWRIAESGGPRIGLALEPEPACAIETTEDAVAFFEGHILSGPAREHFDRASGLSPAAAEVALRRHLGVCFDACHAAVEFEDPKLALARLARAGIPILKLQVSAGLKVTRPDAAARRELRRFAEGVYLHQVVARRGYQLARFVDLPEAIAAQDRAFGAPDDEWRIHFHVPLFRSKLPPFESTQGFVAELLAEQARRPFTTHLEIETYTWDVLPEEYRRDPVAEAVARELDWARARLGEAPAR